MSWYRKYRPLNFADMVGQEHIRKILLSSLQKQNVAHAYLFAGPRGTGKTSAARILGKALNCLQPSPEGEPCNTCAHCNEINENRFVDMIEIDAASNTGVDHIRDLREKVGFSPTAGKAKVYIIDEVHMLSTGAFNALLKTLEEPPSFVYFILATTETHKVPATIQSRCQRFSFRNITENDILQRLKHIAQKEEVTAEEEALQIVARHAAGGMRDAISLFEQHAASGTVTVQALQAQMGLVPQTIIQDFFNVLEKKDTTAALKIIDTFVVEGFSLSEFIKSFLLFLRQQMLQKIDHGESTAAVIHIMDIFDQAQRNMKFAIIPQLPLEVAVITLTQEGNAAAQKKEESKGIFGIFGGEKKEEVQRAEFAKTEKKTVETQGTSKSESTSEQSPQKESATFLAPELSLQGIRTAWPNILEELHTSLLRMSLKNAEIVSFKEDTLELQFPAATWKEQVERPNNQQELMAAFEKIFSRKVGIVCTVREVVLEPTVSEEKNAESKTQEAWNPVEALQEIMGAKAEKREDKDFRNSKTKQ